MSQIKRVQQLVEEANEHNSAERKELEDQRSFHLAQIGNYLHPSVPISNDEVIISDSLMPYLLNQY